MTRYLAALLVLLSPASSASDISLYTGLDIVSAKVGGDFESADAFLILGSEVRLDSHMGLLLEAGVTDTVEPSYDTEYVDEGAVLKASVLMQFKPAGIAPPVSPLLFGGLSHVTMVREECEEVARSQDGVFYGTTTQCRGADFGSTGALIGIGVDIRRRRGLLRFRFSSYEGSRDSRIRVLGVAASF